MLDIGRIDESPKLSALLIIGDVRVDEENRTIHRGMSKAVLIQNALNVFLVLLALYLLLVVAVAIRGGMARRTAKCACEKSTPKPNETNESVPKFSFFNDQRF